MMTGTAQSHVPDTGGGTILILAVAVLAVVAAAVVAWIRRRK
jgi:LPXTG-motif cell wall-anchored protein